MTKDEKIESLKELKKKMDADNSLPLKKGATRLVFGEGNPDSEILFIGEGPGYFEDQKGIPFVGNAGALLNFLLGSIRIKRDEVFITNVVHHRPPQNRDPEPFEIDAYKPYLDKIIEIIDPKVIVTLGRFSMAKFIPGVFISNVHGKERKVKVNGHDVWVFPMYHPAAALRNGDVKTKLTEDFARLREVLSKKEAEKEVVEEEKNSEDNNKKASQMNLL